MMALVAPDPPKHAVVPELVTSASGGKVSDCDDDEALAVTGIFGWAWLYSTCCIFQRLFHL